ncbi:MAG: substrate-binding domain-containing protein [Bacilli bacterium]|jgi:ribose transport system substrate-binding protein|nr:substrate-binding domain-containing protein [Bacilli bacterium]
MKKKIITLCLGLFLIVGLSGCGGNESKESEGKVGFSISTLNNPFFVSMKDAADAKAKEVNLTLEVLDAKDDAAKQVSDIEALINKDIKVLLVNPVDSKAIAPSIKAAQAKGIKVITLDRTAEGVSVDTHIASDNVAGGKMAAEYMVSKLKANDKVIELQGIPGASAAIDRGQGFDDAVKGKLDIVAKQTANFDRAQGLSVMENLAQANPGFKGVFAQNDEMIMGALQAISDKEVITVGFDGTDDALQAIKDGKLDATVIQQPDKIGALGMENAAKLIKGEAIEKTIPVDLVLVTSENVADFLK